MKRIISVSVVCLYASCITFLDNLLDELSHVLTQCFTARPFTLPMPVEGMGAGMLLMTVMKERHTHTKKKETRVRQ